MSRIVLPVILLVAIGGGMVYVRLQNGAISLKPLAGPIARAIAADLPGMSVTIDDASALLAPERGLEFRLSNVKLLDQRGAIVAAAPDAAVNLSLSALWSGRIAPSRIILIEPSLVLQHRAGGGLTFSIEPGQRAEGDDRLTVEPRVGASVASSTSGSVTATTTENDIGGAIVGLVAGLGEAAGSAGYVKGLGVRNASVIIDSEGQRVTWKIREADIGVDRRREGSVVGANLVVESTRGPWQMNLLASRKEGVGALTIDTRITGLVPAAMASNSPLLAPLSALDIPLSGTASLRMTELGATTGVDVDLEIGRGVFAPGLRGNGKLAIDGGRVQLAFDPAKQQITLKPSRIASGNGWITLAGTATSGAAGAPWQIVLDSIDGMVAPDDFGLQPKPIDAVRIRGSYQPTSGVLDITEGVVRAGGGEISMTAHVPPRSAATKLSLQGRISPMPVEALKLLWPPIIAPAAREWSGKQIVAGRLASGTFIVEDVGHGIDRGRAAGDGIRVAVSIEGQNARIHPRPGFHPIEAPRVLVRLEGQQLDISAPEATLVTGPQRRLPLRGARMIANEVSSPTAMGDLTLRALGPLLPAMDLAEQQASRNGRSATLPGEGLDGRIDAQVRIAVPLGEDVHAEDTRVDLRGRITDGRLRNVFGSYDVTGATLGLELTDQQLDLKGDLSLGGVPAKLSLRRIFAASEAEQPPILLSANLDTADRTQLGLDVNDFVVGEMPVEVLISPRQQGDSQVLVRASLVKSELVIEPLAWKKAAGRPATLQFEIARPSRQRTELQNFRIVGEDISLSGTLVLDGRNKLREFSFPELTLHVVSRLQLSGNLRNDNIWDVTVKGQTLDGRDFLQSMYALDQIRSKPAPPSKDKSGIDLKAEIDNVLGHNDLALKTLRLQMQNRGGRTVALSARGIVEGNGREAGRPLDVTITQNPREPRRFVARSDDAGQAFRLIGFFQNMMSGRMVLDMNLDGGGDAEKIGQLAVNNFAILGDPVGTELPDERSSRTAKRQVTRSRLDFDSMNAKFKLGNGQVVILDADLRGQVLGVVLNGRADFRANNVHLEGTYVPLQGLNSAIGQFPILGIILAGPRGEGVIGMKFDVRGSMSRPQIQVNPVSIVPGLLREMMKISNPDLRISPREAPASAPPPKAQPQPKKPATRASSAPETGKAAPSGPRPSVDPEGGWSSNKVVPPAPRPARTQ